MPTDFMDAVRALRIGETSPVVQTKLGFHILRLTEMQPARSMSFEEARSEIAAELQNAKRREAVRKLIVDLARDAEIVRE
jgi:parvulin-like peptidyl-prolyl isomerase